MKIIADLHFHSKYSRAVSPQMELTNLAEWGRKKGIDLLTTADFTHPLWFQELKTQLKEVRPGVYQLKDQAHSPFFILTTELSLIFGQNRIHLLVLAPSLEVAEKINQKLTSRGFNLLSDGRPILGLAASELVPLLKEIDPKIIFIPAHVWTPWFSLYGSRSGFNSIKECFGAYADEIKAIETGLSSDPLMNWQIKELDSRVIVSFSDAHGPLNLGREVTIFELPENFSYDEIIAALQTPYPQAQTQFLPHIASTIEFYPEEGKYHYTGHRKCGVRHSPEDSEKLGTTCPVCGKPLTVGVMHRVKTLSRPEKITPEIKFTNGLRLFYHPQNQHHPYITLVPLQEIIAEAEGVSKQSKRVQEKYLLAIDRLGGEFNILLKTPLEKIAQVLGERITDGIDKNRRGEIIIEPGYDGVYGKVQIWPKKSGGGEKKEQMSLF